jgi:dTDP-L-rhamnose 4-epimerase
MTDPAADYEVFNVGTGRPVSVLQVAEVLAGELGWHGGVEVLSQFRAGDIRHCYADISRIRQAIGYEPRYRFEDGVSELVRWVAVQRGHVASTPALSAEAQSQLAAHGLIC